MSKPVDEILTTKEAAAILGITQSRVRQLIREERIEAINKNGGGWLIERDHLLEFASHPRQAGRPRRKEK